MTRQRLAPVLIFWLLLPLTAARYVQAQTVNPSGDDTVLKQIILFGRHGVRSAAFPASTLATLATRPYPDFGVPTGYLTLHGAEAEFLLGDYYRGYLLSESLLTGDTARDLKHSYFRANSIQRSNVSAAVLGLGLFPLTLVPVHSFALGTPDPIFDPISTKVATVDSARAVTEITGEFNNGAAVYSASSAEFSLIRSILFDYPNGTQPPPPAPAGKVDAASLPIPLTAVTTGVATGNVINLGGLGETLYAADPWVMEYADGMPMSDVAWGALTPDTLSQQTRIITLDFAIDFRSPYLDRVQSSNAASHVLRTMKQVVLGKTIPGAFGDETSHVVVVNSSDAYVAGLAEMLKMHWQLPGYQPDYCAPGGNLVFELRESKSTSGYVVRAFYTAQTFDQLRNLTLLNVDTPPATQQLLIPGGSSSSTSLDVDFDTFEKLMKKAIDPADVQNPATEVPPGVLTGVPLF
jgi:4-phytase/acid phosphatase